MPLTAANGFKIATEDLPLLAATRFRQSLFTTEMKRDIARQLRMLLDGYYVHLPQKMLSMAIDPIRELVLLEDDANLFFADEEFFRRLLNIFKKLRDRHTTIRLPAPWNSVVAFLPLVLESCWEDGRRLMILSKLMGPLQDSMFQPGVEISHWNGMPIALFVESFSFENEGANPYARIAIALRSLTIRPLAYMLPPSEDWVTLTYTTLLGEVRHISIPWRVWMHGVAPLPSGHWNASSTLATARGIDEGIEIINRGLESFYTGRSRPLPTSTGVMLALESVEVPPVLSTVRPFKVSFNDGNQQCGYLRIFSFDVADVSAWIEAMANLLRSMPRRGLIIDVRSNPGGTIPAGEALLQLLTDRPIEFAANVCRATESLRRMSESLEFLSRWNRSLDLVFQTGLTFSQGFPLTEISDYSHLAGAYNGPLVVIVDALSYSTTDYFVAGFEDNEMGKILGIDPTTGAGGANVWGLNQVADFARLSGLPPISSLPFGMDANVAVRRATRVGRNAGLPLEGIGASVDAVHLTTRQDLLSQNEDLIIAALNLMEG